MHRTAEIGCVAAVASMAITGLPTRAEDGVKVEKLDGGGVAVTAAKYSATINSDGLIDLKVDNTMLLEGGFGDWIDRKWQLWPGAGKPSINVIADLVAIRSGEKRIEYTFGPDELGIETEGYMLAFTYNPAMVVAAVGPNGTGGPLRPRVGCANSTGMILGNGQMLASTAPLHVGYQLTPKIVPSVYPGGVLKPGKLLKLTMKFQDVSMAEGIGGVKIKWLGIGYGDLATDGSVGYGLAHLPGKARGSLETSQSNSGGKDSDPVTYHLTVKDHYFEGHTVHEATQTVAIPAGDAAVRQWKLPALAPGFYYLTISATMDGKELTRIDDVLAVDLPHYRHPLTRPPDFGAFWRKKLTDMRVRPFNEELTGITEETVVGPYTFTPTAERKIYRMEFDGHDGRRMTGMLTVPVAPGPHMGSTCPWDPGVSLYVPFPEEATFRTWVSKDESNLLECILVNRRCIDYLKSRPDVNRLFLFGSSRSGPVNWVTAAIDPDRIAGLSIHVPTSFGCSWMDKKYRGWGEKPNAMSLEEYTAMAAYVDPVNHAPDMKVPFINAYGDRDGLSQPQGIEVAFQLSPATWKRMSRDRGGHARTDGFKALQKQFAEYLETAPPMQGDLKILTEH